MILLDALSCNNSQRIPIWFMRQAGRYLPSYRQLKNKFSLLEMFHQPDIIEEVTLLPFQEKIPYDAAIIFSDILTILDGFQKKYNFVEKEGPVIAEPLEIGGILPIHIPAYDHVIEGIKRCKKALKVPLLGFAGAPFTIASYLIEGGSSSHLPKTKKWLFSDPEGFQRLIDQITDATIDYLKLQIGAGVEAVQIFDSWANGLDLESFRKYSLAPMKKIVQALNVPVILFCRGSCFFAEELVKAKPAAISLDFSGDLLEMRKKVPRNIAVQGNLDPSALYGSRESIKKSAEKLLQGMREDRGYIFNLGHGILPDTPLDNVRFLVDYVVSHS